MMKIMIKAKWEKIVKVKKIIMEMGILMWKMKMKTISIQII